MYRVITTFRDLEDGHLYHAGDPFPHDGREINGERLKSLISGENLAHMRLIEQTPINIPDEPKARPTPVKRRKTKD